MAFWRNGSPAMHALTDSSIRGYTLILAAIAPGDRLLRDVLTRVNHNRRQNLTILALAVLSIAGLAVGVWLVAPQAGDVAEVVDEVTPEAALVALDAGRLDQARGLAAELRMRELPPESVGIPSFVLGAAMSHHADHHDDELERRQLYVLAARYLEESRQTGVPVGREGQAEFLWGRALHHAGRFSAAQPLLASAVASYPSRQAEALRLLTDAYRYDSPPRLDEALEVIERRLALPTLDRAERDEVLLAQGDLLLSKGHTAQAEAVLNQIPEDSANQAQALILLARLLMQDADELLKGGAAATREQALQRLLNAQVAIRNAQELAPDQLEVMQQGEFQLALSAYKAAPLRATRDEQVADLRAALPLFDRLRRVRYEFPEGVTASLRQAEILYDLGDDDAAVPAFLRALSHADDTGQSGQPWLAPQELPQRLETAVRAYRDGKKFAQAIRLADALAKHLPAPRSLELQAGSYEAWSQHLADAAAAASPSQAAAKLVAARQAWRRTGAVYAKLAQMRFATPEFPHDLWRSGECLLKGHDFEQAIATFETYLRDRPLHERPRALAGLGEAWLSRGDPEQALRYLNECLEFYPRDPLSYRARILAARAHVERQDVAAAKQQLLANIEHDELTPRSQEWRESLFELGKLHYRDGMKWETESRLQGVDGGNESIKKEALQSLEKAQASFQAAIRAFEEAITRDPDAREAVVARYMTAESYRQAAKLPRKRLPLVTIEKTRDTLNGEINQLLDASVRLHRELVDALNARLEQGELSETEQRILRNSYFARADALFDSGRFDEAIQAYSDATNRYQHEPESLEAYVQIATCHRQMNRESEARGTLEQAKVVLQRVRTDADFTATTRYTREQWGQLLDWLTGT